MKIAQTWGVVEPPPGVEQFSGGTVTGMQTLLSIVLRSLIMLAGIYSVISILLAGYAFISASGDPKRISDATARIWQSVLGFVITAGAFVLAGLIGKILFDDANALLQLRYFRPN